MKKYRIWIVGLIVLCAVVTGFFLEIAPDSIPAHYNVHGEADRWGSKYEFLIFPTINLVFGATMAALAAYERKGGRELNARIVGTMAVLVLILMTAMWVFFMLKAIGIAEQTWDFGSVGEKTLMLLLMVSLIPIGNVMPKAEMNSIFGLRTKWSAANERCWQKSQRLGGYTCICLGLVGVVLISLCPANLAGYIGIALILIMLFVSLFGSYRIYKEDKNKS